MKLAMLHAADLTSLALAAPATLSTLVCSFRSGQTGVGRHSAAFGCLAAAGPATAAADAAGALVTVTACEAAILTAFCCLQVVRLLASAAQRLSNAATRLQLHSLTAGLLLVATASLAVNNPGGSLYSVSFALQFLALAAQLAGLGLAIALLIGDGEWRGRGRGRGRGRDGPVCESTFGYLATSDGGSDEGGGDGQRLPFADEDERLVYEFRGDGRLEWRLGEDRGDGGVFSVGEDQLRSSTV